MRKSPFPFRSGELKFYLHGIRMQSGTGHGKNGYRLMATGFCMSRKKSPGTPQNVDTQYRWSYTQTH